MLEVDKYCIDQWKQHVDNTNLVNQPLLPFHACCPSLSPKSSLPCRPSKSTTDEHSPPSLPCRLQARYKYSFKGACNKMKVSPRQFQDAVDVFRLNCSPTTWINLLLQARCHIQENWVRSLPARTSFVQTVLNYRPPVDTPAGECLPSCMSSHIGHVTHVVVSSVRLTACHVAESAAAAPTAESVAAAPTAESNNAAASTDDTSTDDVSLFDTSTGTPHKVYPCRRSMSPINPCRPSTTLTCVQSFHLPMSVKHY